MTSPNKIKTLFQSDWFISIVILIVFLLTNGYKYNWDDQHLEIPLLKSLIDPALYAGDYYVESLKKNFTSFFYPILSRCITVEQVPAAYFILYLFSRYFLFFWKWSGIKTFLRFFPSVRFLWILQIKSKLSFNPTGLFPSWFWSFFFWPTDINTIGTISI